MADLTVAEDVEALAGQIIPKWHRHLHNLPIAYLFDENGMASKGREILGKVRKANPVENYLMGLEFIVIISLPAWIRLKPEHKEALVDHELCHIIYDDEREAYGLAAHDVEEFHQIIERHGAWTADLQILREGGQLAFPLDKAAPGTTMELGGGAYTPPEGSVQ